MQDKWLFLISCKMQDSNTVYSTRFNCEFYFGDVFNNYTVYVDWFYHCLILNFIRKA